MAIRLNLKNYSTGATTTTETSSPSKKIRLNTEKYKSSVKVPVAQPVVTQQPEVKKPGFFESAFNKVSDLGAAATSNIIGFGKSIIGQYTQPSETVKKTEEVLGVKESTEKNPIAALGQNAYNLATKAAVRTFGPALEPLSKDIADTIMVNEIAPKVASGELPQSALDDIEVLKKTSPQIVGDVAQAVLAIYSPSFLKSNAVLLKNKPIGNALLMGGLRGSEVGTAFGAAQVASSGTKDPKEAAAIMTQSIAAMGLLGAITSGVIPVSSKVLKDVSKIKTKVEPKLTETTKTTLEVQKPKEVPTFTLSKSPETGKYRLSAKPETKLLTAPKTPEVVTGKGFVMTPKADKTKIEIAKNTKAYDDAVKIFTQKPTTTALRNVKAAKIALDTSLGKTRTDVSISPSVKISEQKGVSIPKTETTVETKPVEVPKIKETVVETPKTTYPEATPGVKIKTEAPEFKSKVYQRLKEDNPELSGDVEYTRVKQQEDVQKAIDLINADKQKAYRIAMNQEKSPDVTSTAVNIAMAEKALDEGNHALYAKLVKNRSLEQTRRGQEIVAEKGSVKNNDTSRYVKELIAAKMDALGRNVGKDISETLGKKSTKKKAAVDKIEKEVTKAKEKIDSKRLDIKEAQSIIDALVCK